MKVLQGKFIRAHTGSERVVCTSESRKPHDSQGIQLRTQGVFALGVGKLPLDKMLFWSHLTKLKSKT